jgi:hypothetical protein
MDHLITYKEAAVFLKNPPSLTPRPDFARICALRKHIATALKLLVCPQSAIHGWAGLVMDPVMYALLEPTAPFVGVNKPGNFPVYANFATEATIKMTDKQFKCDKYYYFSFVNINWACFHMLDSTIADQFKVSNTLNMMGWNLSMSVRSIIEQLETLYGKPNTMLLFHNDVLF